MVVVVVFLTRFVVVTITSLSVLFYSVNIENCFFFLFCMPTPHTHGATTPTHILISYMYICAHAHTYIYICSVPVVIAQLAADTENASFDFSQFACLHNN